MPEILKLSIDSKRIYGLDILRAWAIFFVLLEHSQHTLTHNHSAVIKQLSSSYAWYLRYVVFDGVSIFFVLSGFLIGTILIKTLESKPISLKTLLNFWLKRWLRTLPAYLFTLSLLVLLSALFVDKFNVHSTFAYYIFLQNFHTPHPNFFPEAWSLSIEEWFYLLIPSSIFSISKLLNVHFKISFFLSALSILLFSTIIRYGYYSNNLITSSDEWDLLLRKQVITRMDSLMFGLIGAYICFYHNQFWLKSKNISITIGLLLLVSEKLIYLYTNSDTTLYGTVFSFSLTSFSILLLLPYLNSLQNGKGILFRIFTYTSLISYSMYLLNLSVIQFWLLNPLQYLIDHEIKLAIIKFFGYWLFVIVLSTLMYKYIELPFMRLRKIIEIR